MILWIVQTKRTSKSLPEARIFRKWTSAIKYVNTLHPHYIKPVLFRADTYQEMNWREKK